MQSSEGSLEDQMRAASAKERELWKRIDGKYPGQPGHNEAVWREWLDAADRLRALANSKRDAKSSK